MGYKRIVTKKCSECGEVLESKSVDFCDGCNMLISQDDFDKQVRVGFQMKDHSMKDDMVFHSLQCFIDNVDKIDMKGVDNISIDYISPKIWKEIKELLNI